MATKSPPEVGGNAEREELPVQDSDLQRQAAEYKSGLPDTCLGPAGWPQSKVSAKTTTVAPDGLCVVSDLLWREPELLDFATAVQFGLIVVVRRQRVLRLAVGEQAPNFLGLAFHNDHQVAPSVVVDNLSVAEVVYFACD